MRAYRIYYKPPDRDWVMLEPFVHSGIYDLPEVRSAVEIVQQNPAIEGVIVRAHDEVSGFSKLFNIIAVDRVEAGYQYFADNPGVQSGEAA